MLRFQIVSHALCPFAQRVNIVARAAGLAEGSDFAFRRIAYPDMASPPQWALDLNPGMAMPAFVLPGGDVDTDTTQFAARLDAETGAGLGDGSAREAEAIAAAGAVLTGLRGVFTAPDAATLDERFAGVARDLGYFESDVANRPEGMTMTAAAIAPAFTLMLAFAPLRAHPAWADLPATRAWGETLCALPAVAASVAPNFVDEFAAFFAMSGGKALPPPDQFPENQPIAEGIPA